MSLTSDQVTKLKSSIRNSFRVRENQDPVYVDLSGNLDRFSSDQHQVLFGRRGSGKSCLLVHFMRTAEQKGQLVVYVGVDEIKRLGFPDILVRLLLSILESLPGARRRWWQIWRSDLQKCISELRNLLDHPESAETSKTEAEERASSVAAKTSEVGVGASRNETRAITQSFVSNKLDQLERHLQDYKRLLRDALRGGRTRAFILVDDFYLIRRELQPNVVDYLHRLLRGTNYYLKVGTIRHRTTLRKHEGQTIGVELYQDVEEISLDKTFEDLESTDRYLHAMLQSMAERVDKNLEVASLMNPDAPRALTLASGGVPRDFLNIFVDAIEASVQAGKVDRLTPTYIYKASAMMSYKNKMANIKEEAGFDSEALEKLFGDIVDFCLREKRKTVFLVRKDDAQMYSHENEMLQQLMDFKLVHLIDANTSAASGRTGRYTAYTLDFSIFMEPRRRNIEIVEFWRVDGQRRPVGVREAPDYPLSRASAVMQGRAPAIAVEDLLESIEIETDAEIMGTSMQVTP